MINNPALCKNIPESILKNQFPEIWNVYQNWLAEQTVSSNTTLDEIAAQKAALEEAREELTGEGQSLEENSKTM